MWQFPALPPPHHLLLHNLRPLLPLSLQPPANLSQQLFRSSTSPTLRKQDLLRPCSCPSTVSIQLMCQAQDLRATLPKQTFCSTSSKRLYQLQLPPMYHFPKPQVLQLLLRQPKQQALLPLLHLAQAQVTQMWSSPR